MSGLAPHLRALLELLCSVHRRGLVLDATAALPARLRSELGALRHLGLVDEGLRPTPATLALLEPFVPDDQPSCGEQQIDPGSDAEVTLDVLADGAVGDVSAEAAVSLTGGALAAAGRLALARDVIAELEAWLTIHGVSVRAFERAARTGDGAVHSWLGGRTMNGGSIAKVRAFLVSHPDGLIREKNDGERLDADAATGADRGREIPDGGRQNARQRADNAAPRKALPRSLDRDHEDRGSRDVGGERHHRLEPKVHKRTDAEISADALRHQAEQQKFRAMRPAMTVDEAKLILQRKGRKVYRASVTGGAKDRWYVSGEGNQVTDDRLIALAEDIALARVE